MSRRFLVALSLVLVFVFALSWSSPGSSGQKEKEMMTDNIVMVGGQDMFSSKDIIDNAVNSADHTTLVTAVKTAGLVETLKGPGPLTVFAPTNDAFENLPDGTVETLLKPENKVTLTTILTYHVIPGSLSYGEITEKIKAGGGKAELKTASGGTLTAMMNGDVSIVLKDEKGNIANIATYDVYQSNGVIHVIDKVVLPQ